MTADGALIYPEDNVLAGASFPLRKGIFNMITMAGCGLNEALDLATVNPAKVYGLNDRGTIRKGASADLVLFSITDNGILIHQTIIQGKSVYKNK